MIGIKPRRVKGLWPLDLDHTNLSRVGPHRVFDQDLLKLIEEDGIDYKEAVRTSSCPKDFKLMVQSFDLAARTGG
jgi:Tfp pilus assembly ATPase PilU